MNATLKQILEGLGELTSTEMATVLKKIQHIAEEGSRMDEDTNNEQNFRLAADRCEKAAISFSAIN